MKRKLITIFIVLCLIAAIIYLFGIGYYYSGSAAVDLKADLESIYGKEYTGKITETGTQDMVFSVEPQTWFLTDWNFRNAWSMDYKYKCSVIFTNYVDGNIVGIQRISYDGIDPMGEENAYIGAYLILESKSEETYK
ncbi:MAG: hypothetical protein IKV79_00255 [Oscillospiraceae bacterium]|nr:hypothetical protein [Oscillospiraceae bacterium]